MRNHSTWEVHVKEDQSFGDIPDEVAHSAISGCKADTNVLVISLSFTWEAAEKYTVMKLTLTMFSKMIV